MPSAFSFGHYTSHCGLFAQSLFIFLAWNMIFFTGKNWILFGLACSLPGIHRDTWWIVITCPAETVVWGGIQTCWSQNYFPLLKPATADRERYHGTVFAMLKSFPYDTWRESGNLPLVSFPKSWESEQFLQADDMKNKHSERRDIQLELIIRLWPV